MSDEKPARRQGPASRAYVERETGKRRRHHIHGGRFRYPNDSGATGPQQSSDNDDLHARVESGRIGSAEPRGPSVRMTIRQWALVATHRLCLSGSFAHRYIATDLQDNCLTALPAHRITT